MILRQPRLDPASIECSLLAGGTVILRAHGNVTKLAMSASLPTFERLIGRVQGPGWIIDISALGNFEPAAVGVGAEYFRAFKHAGGSKVVLVSGLATARLAAFTLAFAVHLPLTATDSLAAACKVLGIDAP